MKFRTGCVAVGFLSLVLSLSAQTFTSLVSFNGSNGAYPESMSLVQGTDGNLYGTAPSGGAHSGGTVFKVTPTGTLTTLYSFCAQTNCTDGEEPLAGLVLATNGTFYGTTSVGGANGDGTVFSITAGGTLTTLHSFDLTDGAYPTAALIQGRDGNFYGTTVEGGPPPQTREPSFASRQEVR
ncbi:MAG TPA: choice-of-anchor tandem repeat GloVer-containing protein [Terriglobales bacterium]|nr:choice-of-anchor tandem repeat GloVer-containing protein [Terriglobales bacterium]